MKILLVQLSFLGDTILSTPVIAGLKQIYPESAISILTTPISSGLVNNDPFVDEVIVYDKRKKDKGIWNLFKKAKKIKAKKFDVAYSLHRSHRTASLLFLSGIPKRIGFKDAKMSFLYTEQRKKKTDAHAAIRNLSLLFNDSGENSFTKDLRLFAPESQNVSKKLNNLPKNYIVMAPGSAWKTKQWHWEGYLKTAEYYIQQGLNIILIGGKDDTEICKKIKAHADVLDFSGEIALSDTMYIMKNAKLLICNDSMSLHMASAFKTPTVAIFCATSPEFGFGPWQNINARIVEDETLECKPCRRHGSNKCPNGTEACMRVPAEKIINACKELL
ncbi:MAG: lipopolysaccharide heptosyltransferase II [Desulfobacteraceae bacterium]|nr:lipopolysaccharide heptosyltransferase II [Desulfobacteraceae bacterium]